MIIGPIPGFFVNFYQGQKLGLIGWNKQVGPENMILQLFLDLWVCFALKYYSL